MKDLEHRYWVTTAQAAEYAGMHPKTIRDACEAGTLRASQRVKGGLWRIHRDDLHGWLAGDSRGARA